MESLDGIEVARYGVRTWQVLDHDGAVIPGVLNSMYSDYVWRTDTCEAACITTQPTISAWGYGKIYSVRKLHDEPSPYEGCHCGIYAATSLRSLHGQYPNQMSILTGVIAAEGRTIIGKKGFRTSAARIVAYWRAGSPAFDLLDENPCLADAQRFSDLAVMATKYLGGNDLVPKLHVLVDVCNSEGDSICCGTWMEPGEFYIRADWLPDAQENDTVRVLKTPDQNGEHTDYLLLGYNLMFNVWTCTPQPWNGQCEEQP